MPPYVAKYVIKVFNNIKHIYDANVWHKHFLYSNYFISENNDIVYNENTAHISEGYIQEPEYIKITIFYEGKRLSIPFHRLKWETFNKKLIPEGYDIDHHDNNCKNNNIENL